MVEADNRVPARLTEFQVYPGSAPSLVVFIESSPSRGLIDGMFPARRLVPRLRCDTRRQNLRFLIHATMTWPQFYIFPLGALLVVLGLLHVVGDVITHTVQSCGPICSLRRYRVWSFRLNDCV